MSAQLIISVAGGEGNLDDLRAAAQEAVDAFTGKGGIVSAELRHGNPQMPVVEPITSTVVAKTSEGMTDENEITQAALRAEQRVVSQQGVEEAKNNPEPVLLNEPGSFGNPTNETEREALKVKMGAATADEAGIPATGSDEDQDKGDDEAADKANAEAAVEGVNFASPAARQAAIDAGLTKENFKRQRKSNDGGFTKADVERIAGDE